MVCYNKYGSKMFGVPMRTLADHAFSILLIPLAAIAVLAVLSPVQFLARLGGPRNYRAPALETFIRVAGLLLFIGAAITWLRWWKI
jgi:hypothetical protein